MTFGVVDAAPNGSSTNYVCIEQRALGWETKVDGSEACCQFKPEDKRFFLKFIPGSSGKKDGRIRLPVVEVVDGENTFTYKFDGCEVLFGNVFETPLGRTQEVMENAVSLCEKKVHGSFGSNGITYNFFPPILGTPQSMNYSYSQISMSDRAYLSSGQCVQAD